jgi:two-component system, cell cycle response regulator DivK
VHVSGQFTSMHHPAPLALLVDRDPDTRRMYANYLRLSGCGVEEAEDGREALAKAISRHPDVIVTETRLPGINGFDLCRLLHSDIATRTIPIVFVTGDAFKQDLDRAKLAGADAVLVKPCLPEKLLVEVRRVMAMSEELRERVRHAANASRDKRERAQELIEHTRRVLRTPLSKAIPRFQTTDPPAPPPQLVCPTCDQPLRYDHSNVGGVSVRHVEQWDYFECDGGCGTFQYRQRTRKLRKII